MKINLYSLVEGSKKAKGLVVIIDVLRAFSTICYIHSAGVKNIYIPLSIESAFDLKSKLSGKTFLIGERDGKMINGFDFGNSPHILRKIENKKKLHKNNVIFTTSAGTNGIVNTISTDEIITGSFLNHKAVVNYIREKKPAIVSFVAMGEGGFSKSVEDELCAEFFKARLENKEMDFDEIKKKVYHSATAEKFYDNTRPWYVRSDLDICLEIDKFDFIFRVEKEIVSKILCYKIST